MNKPLFTTRMSLSPAIIAVALLGGFSELQKEIKLDGASGVPGADKHRYYFSGTLGMARRIYVRGVGNWNRNDYKTTETLTLSGDQPGNVVLSYQCNRDPWIEPAVNCVLKNVIDNTGIPWAKNFPNRPMSASGTWSGPAGAMSASRPVPPPPPPGPSNSSHAPLAGAMGAMQGGGSTAKPIGPAFKSGAFKPGSGGGRNQGNKTLASAAAALSGPDLVIGAAHIRIVRQCKRNRPVAFADVVLRNIGNQNFPLSKGRLLHVAATGGKADLGGRMKIPKILKGKFVKLHVPLRTQARLPDLAGRHNIRIGANLNKQVAERNYGNNTRMASVVFPAGYCAGTASNKAGSQAGNKAIFRSGNKMLNPQPEPPKNRR